MKNALPFLWMALAAGVAHSAKSADRVFTGGRVLTVDAEDRVAQAIAIRNGEPLLGVYGSDPFGRAEAIDARAALRSYTIWAAHQLFMDKRTGSLETGKRADIAIWDTDFYTAAPAAIKDARCEMTLFDGEVVWRRDP